MRTGGMPSCSAVKGEQPRYAGYAWAGFQEGHTQQQGFFNREDNLLSTALKNL